ncbi:GntR family transcriptional regulator [Actinocrispum wychmicini]|uniref:GntR family transcriptional regulator n=1 Tax=Actinocrispum wychmicini TaxID=1213861 RepID=A0A4R2JMD7_9PSEU|nr:GntR family transcriptional regulator [Actinocrispum wychmicini]TCO58258.1 GntR family transcriptional regulator [Actinocrispum wychmicini]
MKRAEVRERLRTMIRSRQPGDVLPSERNLSEELGVSRPTLRAAMSDLAKDGLLVREHGRGTFTGARDVVHELAPTATGGFTGPDGTGINRVVRFATEVAGARLGRRMRVSPGTELVHVTRVRVVEGHPMAVERLVLPAELVPDVAPADFETGSLYQLLRMRYEVIASKAMQTTEPTVTDPAESDLLGVPLHAPALLFERTTTDTADRVIEYSRSIYRGDRYRITTHLTFDHSY